MSLLNVPVDMIRDAASKLKTYTDDNEDLFGQILNLVNSVESCGDWQGKSMKSLQEVTRKNQKKFEQGMQELYQLGDFLQRYANTMEQTDADVKDQIQRV